MSDVDVAERVDDVVVPMKENAARAAATAITVLPQSGIQLENFAQQVDYAKHLATGREAVPAHLRGNTGACLAIVDMATRWNLSAYMVANKTYIQNDRLCFESQLVHAVLENLSLLDGRLRHRFEGEGDEMVCIVHGTPKGEKVPLEWRSPPLKDLHPGYSDKTGANGKKFVKGSPLWDRKPKVQMFYDTSRDWARIYFPDAMMGIYTPDEIAEGGIGPDNARDVSPDPVQAQALHDRLAAAQQAGHADEGGFAQDTVENGVAEVAGAAGEPEPKGRKGKGAAKKRTTGHGKPVVEGVVADRPDPVAGGGTPEPKPATVEHSDTTGVTTIAGTTVAKVEPGDTPSVPAIKVVDPRTYELHFDGWLAVLTTEADIRARWATERKLRNNCGITSETRKPLEERLEARILEPDVERIP